MTLKLCAFDVETRNRNPEFVQGAIFSDIQARSFIDAGEMIDALASHARKGYTLIAHNAEYDLSVLLWGMGEDVTIRYTNNAFATAQWRYGKSKRTCTIWDSMRLCAGLSLTDLGEAIGVPKYPMPKKLVDPDDWRQDWICDKHGAPGCIECYVLRDAEIVWSYVNVLRDWLEAYGLRLYYSLPRTAIDLWRLFDPGAQQSIQSHDLREFAREGFHGGRCEAFQYGHVGRVYTADFRGFYGSILRNQVFPDMSSLHVRGRSLGKTLPSEGDGTVHAMVDVDNAYCPPLPVSYREKVYFPVGRVVGTWPLSELRASLQHGVTVRQIYKCIWSENTVQPFANTAGILMELREQLRHRKDARELVAKFLLNSIPGRLGVRESAEIVTYRRWRAGMTSDDMRGAELESADGALYLARRSSLRHPPKFANVMWASIVTAAGRTKLYPYLRTAGDALLYCDTDSIHSQVPLPIEGDSPGLLRDTGVYDTGLYLGSKFYSLENDTGESQARAKGIPRKHAVEFLKAGHVAYQTTLGVVDGILRGTKPCVWVDVDRVARYAPGTRTIMSPGVLDGSASVSRTVPVVFGALDGHEIDVHDMVTRDMI